MASEVIAVFIPIIMVLVIGAVTIVYFYLKSRERQLLIEKGLSTDEIKKFFESRKGDGLTLLKIGIISIAFGIGLGFGMFMEDATSKEFWVPLSLFVGTGIGFVLANVLSDKMKKNRL